MTSQIVAFGQNSFGSIRSCCDNWHAKRQVVVNFIGKYSLSLGSITENSQTDVGIDDLVNDELCRIMTPMPGYACIRRICYSPVNTYLISFFHNFGVSTKESTTNSMVETLVLNKFLEEKVFGV